MPVVNSHEQPKPATPPAEQKALIPTTPASPPPLPPAPTPLPPAPSATQKIPDVSAAVSATNKALSEPKPAGSEAPNPAKAASSNAPALSVTFKSTETTVPLSVQPQLDEVAKQLIHNEKLRVTLIAYASAVGDQVSTARRVSLSRALSVRSYLLDAGVSNLRINVQAEGDKNPGGDPDRVDLMVQESEGK
jgi:outer membrane protein OmpA-like peptidoglycan-associated protein